MKKKRLKETVGANSILPGEEMSLLRRLSKSILKKSAVTLGLLIMLFIVVPVPRFKTPLSTVVLSAEGNLLGARIADDGQWRFPPSNVLPEKFTTALLCYEDRWFWYHPGFNPVSMLRAAWLNMKHRKIVSGGSTLTMQVARLSRNNPPRNLWGKLLETFMAIKLELLKSKKHVLLMYSSSAPFGGNVVGVEAASWRYFGRPPIELSWGEAATLAVLPNSPALIHPGRNQELLKKKRDQLLFKLFQKNQLDSLSYQLALLEAIPALAGPLPGLTPHLTDKFWLERRGQQISTTIHYSLQEKVNHLLNYHNSLLLQNGIRNLAAVVVDVETGEVRAWAGNAPGSGEQHGQQVDIVTAPRSSGSILKPFLYAAMLHNGEILPNTLIPDIPVNFSGYAPKNFDSNYSGAVPASSALSRSLNIPAVEMLSQFGEARFLDFLKRIGFSTFNKSAEHYGLSLILGGGETTLFELAGVYASFARVLKHFTSYGGYTQRDFFMPVLTSINPEVPKCTDQPVVTASSIWFTFKAMQEVNRPEGRIGWQYFSSSGNVAWKTGTSFGYRDAWALAITTKNVVAVWAGNANGEGRPGLTGTLAAAPLLFDILDLLPREEWFEEPVDDITFAEVCPQSGYKASPYCKNPGAEKIQLAGLQTGACPYHQLVHLSSDRNWQVNASCYPLGSMLTDTLFLLPPAMEWYYRKQNPSYRLLPPPLPGCTSAEVHTPMELLYPRNLQKIFVPRELDGSMGEVVFEAIHRHPNKKIFWYIDENFISETEHFHQLALAPAYGMHTLTLVDDEGNQLQKKFFVTSGQ